MYKIICAWCNRVISDPTNGADRTIKVSHGVCESCYDDHLEALNQFKREVVDMGKKDFSTDLGDDG